MRSMYIRIGEKKESIRDGRLHVSESWPGDGLMLEQMAFSEAIATCFKGENYIRVSLFTIRLAIFISRIQKANYMKERMLAYALRFGMEKLKKDLYAIVC